MNLAILGVGTVLAVPALWGMLVVLAVGWGRHLTGGVWHFRHWDAKRWGGHRYVKDRCGVYVQYFLLWVAYVGQTIDGDNRMDAHGKTIRSLLWTHGVFIECEPHELNQLEPAMIRLMPWLRWFRQNRTRGGS